MSGWWQGVARGALPLPTGGAYLATPQCLPAAESPALTLDFTLHSTAAPFQEKFCVSLLSFSVLILLLGSS